jgi:hypothetical protein
MKRLTLILVFAVMLCPLVRAVEVSRVLKTFDFEERRLGNDEELPMSWVKVKGPGLPHYVNGRLATDSVHGGRYSFRFDLNGGGLIYRYAPGLIKVQHGAHYRVEGFTRTTVLPNARARMTAYFADVDGHALHQTVVHSELHAATSDQEPWKQLSLELTADAPEADSLVLELELLQPQQYSSSKLGDRALFDQDIRGSAWWDDITVAQVPEVALRTEHPGNLFRRGEPVRIAVLVSDRFTDDLTARTVVRNAEGKEVYQKTATPRIAPGGGRPGQQKRMLLEIPDLAPGWYQVVLEMSSHGQPLGSQSLNVVLFAGDGKPSPPDGRFGFVATSLPFDAWGALPKILPELSAGRVKLAVWSDQGDVEQSHGADFDKLLVRFAELGIAPTACLLAPPPQLEEKLDGRGWSQLLKVRTQDWQPDLAFLVSRHANHLARWQLGPDGSDAFVTDPAMREVYRRVYQEFSLLVNKPDLAMPWPAWYELSGDMPATVALSVPPSVLPSQLPLYVQELRGRTDHTISLTLQPLDRARYGRDVEVRDLAQRVIYALAADATRIDLPLPAHATRDQAGGVEVQPEELLLIERTLISTLSGAHFKGRVAIGDGIEAFLFDRAGQGILALWGQADVAGVKDLALNLGERPVSIDLWGNVAPLPRPRGDDKGRVSVAVGTMPVFLVDIDGAQAQLRASVAIDQPLLESSFRPHPRRIEFVNCYGQAITGTLHIKSPPGWILNPPTFNFSLNPGEKFNQSLTIQFPYNSFAGVKALECEFLIQGPRNSTFTVPIALQLGLSDVGMQTIALRDGRDILVQQMVTNYGDKTINYSAFAIYPDQARQERLVTELAPGATTIKRYRFENVPREKGGRIRVGLKELQGSRILNDEVDVQ